MMKMKVYSMASDPIYIGTGGYTIGRVDNTIVRDPITRIPKIPGSSFAGTMRFYSALELQFAFKEDYRKSTNKRRNEELEQLFNSNKDWVNYGGNRWALMKCAGQDAKPNEYYEDNDDISKLDNNNSGHCGHCIVCKTFGYSKNNISQQGIAFFSDLNIIFFPVYTRLGVMWITSKQLLEFAGMELKDIVFPQCDEIFILGDDKNQSSINIGWLNLPCKKKDYSANFGLDSNILKHIEGRIILVPDDLISEIINSNLEVRTSVSIDPLTGASKEGALFTSEAIPRGTVFYGDIRLMERPISKDLPGLPNIKSMIKDASKYYDSLGIGGMTTRGFGRMKVFIDGADDDKNVNTEGGQKDGTKS